MNFQDAKPKRNTFGIHVEFKRIDIIHQSVASIISAMFISFHLVIDCLV